ncbi:MFS transporter [Brevibacillus reuszeri]|uniref:MFS transporter n=1 Tax=Brevibacillus reuszeri TaxID=54915 RepID=A0A0K9YQT7_9BACL|nr:MDR family MFS transporter [Brevibacillus reuszeri]KNB70545.1 MFS transporter [Brevibacillus reuszeri]MED1861488.1 MDR family MFS transporter [Brevibacillus reuszeri]GED70034.1 MFS transporter [Brevibacillus reuszeri]
MLKRDSSASTSNVNAVVTVNRESFIYALIAIIPGMMMVMLNSTAMNVAIPSLTQDFQVSFEILQWVINGYLLAMAVTVPLSGWFSDRIGAGRAYLMTVMLFIIGSLLCSLAQNSGQLIAFRIIQGLGGGMIQPIGMAMIFRLAPPDKKGQIMGMLGIPMLIAPATGPILSGWLLEATGWQWIFLINLPIGALAVWLGLSHLCKHDYLQKTHNKQQSFDRLGVMLAPTAFVLLTLSINQLSSNTWGSIMMGGTGALLLIWLCIHELRHENPILELRAFRAYRFRRGMIVSSIQYAALNGSIVFIPLFLQNYRSYSPFDAGLIMSMLAITSGLLMPVGGKVYDRFGIRPLACSGMGTIAVALLLLSWINEITNHLLIAGIVGLLGIGMGLCMMSLNTYILQSAPASMISRITPLTAAGANLIIPVAIACLSNFLAMRTFSHTVNEYKYNPVAAEMAAYSDTFLLTACIALGGAFFSLLLKPLKDKK